MEAVTRASHVSSDVEICGVVSETGGGREVLIQVLPSICSNRSLCFVVVSSVTGLPSLVYETSVDLSSLAHISFATFFRSSESFEVQSSVPSVLYPLVLRKKIFQQWPKKSRYQFSLPKKILCCGGRVPVLSILCLKEISLGQGDDPRESQPGLSRWRCNYVVRVSGVSL